MLLLGRKFSFIVWVLCFDMQNISCVWIKFNLKVGLEIKVFLAQTIKFWSRYVQFANICIRQKRLTEVYLMIKFLNLIVSSSQIKCMDFGLGSFLLPNFWWYDIRSFWIIQLMVHAISTFRLIQKKLIEQFFGLCLKQCFKGYHYTINLDSEL